VSFEPRRKEIARTVQAALQPGDIVLTLGAGDVWKVGVELARGAGRRARRPARIARSAS
jgi:UDP-N-acetylmuramate-alanine ligase